MALNIEDAYPEDGAENIRWDTATDTYLTLNDMQRYQDERGFLIRPEVLPDTVIEQQDEMF